MCSRKQKLVEPPDAVLRAAGQAKPHQKATVPRDHPFNFIDHSKDTIMPIFEKNTFDFNMDIDEFIGADTYLSVSMIAQSFINMFSISFLV